MQAMVLVYTDSATVGIFQAITRPLHPAKGCPHIGQGIKRRKVSLTQKPVDLVEMFTSMMGWGNPAQVADLAKLIYGRPGVPKMHMVEHDYAQRARQLGQCIRHTPCDITTLQQRGGSFANFSVARPHTARSNSIDYPDTTRHVAHRQYEYMFSSSLSRVHPSGN